MNIVNIKMTFAVALVLVLTATGLWAGGEEEERVAAAKKYVTDPTTGKVVTAPEYGGTITYGRVTAAEHPDVFYISGWATHYIALVNEKLAIGDWALDRNVYDWRSSFVPLFAFTGNLAESWEVPDDKTYVFHIRKGVHWHNKPPMNGRELTAKDIEYNYHRILGLGKFSEAGPSPVISGMNPEKVESVTATDEWTVVYKVKEPEVGLLRNIIGSWLSVIYPPEVIEEHGDYKDWRNTVGTGPFELTDVVEGSSYTWTKNPDYWRYDEKYPQNRLPYVDEITTLIMPEPATRLAALRAGTIDMLGTVGDTQLRSIDQIESLQRTNPEIKLWPFKSRSDQGFLYVGLHRPPWNDIRVRQAMQMALDLETINNTFFKGYGDPTPNGRIANDVTGIGTPFEEWPEEVKKHYRYDPKGAEALLDEAGYPRGADGIRFKTGMAYFERYNASYAELIAEYWREIGVEIGIDVMAAAGFSAVTPDQDTYRIQQGEMAWRHRFFTWLWNEFKSDSPWTNTGYSVPEYDALIDAAEAATTEEEQHRILKEANTWHRDKHLMIWGPEVPTYQATQPWLIGYNGEFTIGALGQFHNVLTRLWIDSELKKEMGH